MLQLPSVAANLHRSGREGFLSEQMKVKKPCTLKGNLLMAVVLVCRGYLDHEVQQEWQVPGERGSGCGSACLGGLLESGGGEDG